MIIDPAAKDEQMILFKEKINEIIDSGSNIIATIFTHKHPDHIGDMDEISKVYKAPIWGI